MLRLKPIAQSGIMNLRLAIPESRCQSALNLQMVQLQLHFLDALRKVFADVIGTHVQTRNPKTIVLSSDNHTHLSSANRRLRLVPQ